MTSHPPSRARAGLFATLALAACARQQPPAAMAATPPGAPPVAAPAAPPPPRPQVKTVAFAGDVICALSEDGHLRLWNGSSRAAVALDLDYVHALSADGTAAVTTVSEGDHGTRLEVWEPATRTRIVARQFETGIDSVLGMSRDAVALRVNIPASEHPEDSVPAVPAPRWRGTVWNFARDVVNTKNMVEHAEGAADISADGQRLAFTSGYGYVQYVDLHRGRTSFARIAADWRDPVPEIFVPSKPHSPEPPPWSVLSVRLDADGKYVYVTYVGVAPREGWRLERWTPTDAPDAGPVTRLAATAEKGLAQVLAVSRDGRLVVLGHFAEPLMVRRAPRWTAEHLGTDAASAATVSPDGKRIVSGHFDGRLRLWDARSGKLLATAEP